MNICDFSFLLNFFHLHGLMERIQNCDIHKLQKSVNTLLYKLSVM